MSTKLLNPFSSDLRGEQRPKAVPPKPNCLMADIDATFVQKVFDVAKRKRILNIKHHRQTDDLGARLEVAKWRAFCHPAKLSHRAARLKPVFSDKTLIRTLRDAHLWAGALREGTSLLTIARNTAHHDAFIRTRGQLAFLSPKIQIAIRDGTLPPEVTLKRMLRQPVPLDWITQERMFGL